MGKIRVKTFDESSEADEAKLKAKREMKKAEKVAQKNADKAQDELYIEKKEADNENIVTEAKEHSEIQVETQFDQTPVETSAQETKSSDKKHKKEKFITSKEVGARHKQNLTIVSKTQNYNLDQALSALKKFKKSNFDETVELHINTKEKGISGQLTLPHGTGKTLVIKIADDAILAEVEKGKINFDVLVATPSMMPKLAKVARVLGPRGLMPNPKNGTITENPEDAVKKLSGGQISYKTESASPIIHAIVGKVSFDDKKLSENITAFLSNVGSANIKNVTLKSTMSPAIRLNFAL